MKKLTSVALLALAAFLALATSGDSEKKEEKKTKNASVAARLTATALYKAYEANEVDADNKYKGKVLAVSGIVDSIGKDISDTPYVALKTSSPIATVQCMFSKSHSSELAGLKKGEEITLKGVCKGKMMNVLLRGCVKE